jgi:hypothetical protein
MLVHDLDEHHRVEAEDGADDLDHAGGHRTGADAAQGQLAEPGDLGLHAGPRLQPLLGLHPGADVGGHPDHPDDLAVAHDRRVGDEHRQGAAAREVVGELPRPRDPGLQGCPQLRQDVGQAVEGKELEHRLPDDVVELPVAEHEPGRVHVGDVPGDVAGDHGVAHRRQDLGAEARRVGGLLLLGDVVEVDEEALDEGVLELVGGTDLAPPPPAVAVGEAHDGDGLALGLGHRPAPVAHDLLHVFGVHAEGDAADVELRRVPGEPLDALADPVHVPVGFQDGDDVAVVAQERGPLGVEPAGLLPRRRLGLPVGQGPEGEHDVGHERFQDAHGQLVEVVGGGAVDGEHTDGLGPLAQGHHAHGREGVLTGLGDVPEVGLEADVGHHHGRSRVEGPGCGASAAGVELDAPQVVRRWAAGDDGTQGSVGDDPHPRQGEPPGLHGDVADPGEDIVDRVGVEDRGAGRGQQLVEPHRVVATPVGVSGVGGFRGANGRGGVTDVASYGGVRLVECTDPAALRGAR